MVEDAIRPPMFMPPPSLAPTVQNRVDRALHRPPVEFGLIVLILLSVLLMFMEVALLPSSRAFDTIIHLQRWLTWIFWLELGLRAWSSRNKQRFWIRYWWDILAVLPYPPQFVMLRLLRLLRLMRVGILLNRNLGRLSPSLAVGLGAQIGLIAVLGVILLTGALGVYLIEGGDDADLDTLADAFWWSVLTLVAAEPIGAEPSTHLGRLLTLIVMLGGLTLFAVVTGLVSAVMVQRLRSTMDFRDMELSELRHHTVICGWNRNGLHIVEELLLDPAMQHSPILLVAEFEETPEPSLRHLNLSHLYCYAADYTRIDVLETIGIVHADRAILLADTTRPRSDQDIDARTVLAALTIEKINPAVYTCAQLLDRRNDVQLKIAGVDDVIVPDEITSHMIASSARTQGSVEILAELLTVQVGNQIYKVAVPPAWIDLPFWQAVDRLKRSYDALIIAIEVGVPKRKTLVNPPASYRLGPKDQLVVISRKLPVIVDL